MKTPDESRVRMIPVDHIHIINPRVRDKKKFERIVENIAAIGLKKPITVTIGQPAEDGSEAFDLVCGQGRLEAFIALGQREIPALVRGMSKTDSLLASLIENIARRRGRALDRIKTIQWMKDQGHNHIDIAAKTGLGADYVKSILSLLRNGEERLLDAVLHGKIPITIAVGIAGTTDEESQRLLMETYELKEMNQKTLRAFRRIVDLRRTFGKDYGQRRNRSATRTTAESLVRAYRLETQRQMIMVKKAKLCEARLRSISATFRVLVADEDYINLLRAEELDTMPKFLAERARQSI
ncbi:MAG: ParB/RepB/Spo0J family partition protein [bacterium]|nr:ParB/RepB/Spo0J family partition protein [bacterium]MDI1343084.1 ParB/RepB/Spo0J family partition protein [Pseudolabrys sp.]